MDKSRELKKSYDINITGQTVASHGSTPSQYDLAMYITVGSKVKPRTSVELTSEIWLIVIQKQ